MRLPRIAIAVIVFGLFAGSTSGSTIDPGWDLFQTTPGTNFAGVPFVGVPLVSFDFDNVFGRGIGVRNDLGLTDTIVQRNLPATVASPPGTAAPIPIEMVALQLVSAAPTNVFGPLAYYYITLQSAHGGPATTGQMTISFDPTGNAGTFNSFFDVFFDIHINSLNGPIVFSNVQPLQLTSAGSQWDRTPPPGAVVIDKVNNKLNGTNQANDFWPGDVSEQHPSGAMHNATPARVPESSPVAMWTLLALCTAAATWWHRKKAWAVSKSGSV